MCSNDGVSIVGLKEFKDRFTAETAFILAKLIDKENAKTKARFLLLFGTFCGIVTYI